MATLNPTDLFDVRSLLTEEEQMIQDTVARFVDERALPLMAEAFDKANLPDGTDTGNGTSWVCWVRVLKVMAAPV